MLVGVKLFAFGWNFLKFQSSVYKGEILWGLNGFSGDFNAGG